MALGALMWWAPALGGCVTGFSLIAFALLEWRDKRTAVGRTAAKQDAFRRHEGIPTRIDRRRAERRQQAAVPAIQRRERERRVRTRSSPRPAALTR